MADKQFTSDITNAMGKCKLAGPPVKPPLPSGVVVVKTKVDSLSDRLDSLSINALHACIAGAVAKIGKDYGDAHWNSANISIAYAGGRRLESSLATAASDLGNQLVIVGGLPLFDKAGMILGTVQYSNIVPIQETAHRTNFRYGARATIGQPSLNFFSEIYRQQTRNPGPNTAPDANGWSGGIELRLADGLWLATGLGKGVEVKGSPTVVIANLKWGITDKAQFGR